MGKDQWVGVALLGSALVAQTTMTKKITIETDK
jgi:hypothetical protein